jgi:hypothetical protein
VVGCRNVDWSKESVAQASRNIGCSARGFLWLSWPAFRPHQAPNDKSFLILCASGLGEVLNGPHFNENICECPLHLSTSTCVP